MSDAKRKVSPLLLQAFLRMQVDPAPFLSWMDRARPLEWVRCFDALSLPSTADLEIVALRLRYGSADIEIRTSRSRMISDGDVVTIVAEARPEVLAAAALGKPLAAVADTKFLGDSGNVVLSAVVLERPRRLILSVCAPAIEQTFSA